MTLHLKVENTPENLDLYEERELMFTAWENYKSKIDQEIRMPEVDLVQRVLAAPLQAGIKNVEKAHKGAGAYA